VPQKEKDSRPRDRMGRPKVDPKNLRSYRLVMRVNPDLADALSMLADEVSISRSLFIERVLISFVNQDPRFRLAQNGRRIPDNAQQPAGAGSFADLGQRWRRWSALRHDVLGDDIMSGNYDIQPPAATVVPGEARPPVPRHMLPPEQPTKGGARKKKR
jgi:hypothetical protein